MAHSTAKPMGHGCSSEMALASLRSSEWRVAIRNWAFVVSGTCRSYVDGTFECMCRRVQTCSGTHGRARSRILCPLATMICPPRTEPLSMSDRKRSRGTPPWRLTQEVLVASTERRDVLGSDKIWLRARLSCCCLGRSLTSSRRATFKREWED